MVKPSELDPSNREWADAKLAVDKHEWRGRPDATIFELKKTITKNGRTFTQSVWINIHQLKGVARDHCF